MLRKRQCLYLNVDADVNVDADAEMSMPRFPNGPYSRTAIRSHRWIQTFFENVPYEVFVELLSYIEIDITKQTTISREPIPAKMKLAATLYY